MKLNNILDKLTTEEVTDSNLSRRDAMTKGFSFGIKAALTAIPLALFEMNSNKANAAPPPPPSPSNAQEAAVLNFALTLEYLEAAFYKKALSSPNLIPASDLQIFMQISRHETEHVAFLFKVITDLGVTPVAMPTFDFTANGMFPTVFTNYQVFLAVANAFEDTGVRAYKGGAGLLIGSGPFLTAALDIHSVEARHAAEIRRLRGLKGWISFAEPNGLPPAIYAGEDNTVQGGIDLTTLTPEPKLYITEAFDEPLTMAQVLAIAAPFIK